MTVFGALGILADVVYEDEGVPLSLVLAVAVVAIAGAGVLWWVLRRRGRTG